jgi:hypothetical protein
VCFALHCRMNPFTTPYLTWKPFWLGSVSRHAYQPNSCDLGQILYLNTLCVFREHVKPGHEHAQVKVALCWEQCQERTKVPVIQGVHACHAAVDFLQHFCPYGGRVEHLQSGAYTKGSRTGSCEIPLKDRSTATAQFFTACL